MIADGDAAALPLFAWLSPAFPVGAFAYSHGLEWAVENGDIVDAATLRGWIGDILERGAGRSDAILLARAHDRVAAGDDAGLAAINALTLALAPSRERLLETTTQGDAFVAAVAAAWPCPAIERLRASGGPFSYPVAVATAAAGHGIGRDTAVAAFLLAFVGNLVSAAVRLGPIGQTDGQKIVAALVPAIPRIAGEAALAPLDAMGSCVLRADIASLRHETQYSRLFRS